MTADTPKSRIVGTVVCLPVRDLDASLSFYRSVFDLPELGADEGIIVVELPGLSLFLIEEHAFGTYTGKVGRGVAYPGSGSAVILSCATSSRRTLDEMLRSAASSGGTIARRAGEDEDLGLYLGYFFDPDGHQWELAHAGSGA
ncbi:VOC family protein [Brachybacterium hainanense]|uniref:VOC family protein n=1 Tax=Brachybacterium hainanense TaxID=1541174 RepID=A0ABV6RF37_9MICO